MVQVISLEELTGGLVKNLAGHDRGLSARQHFNLADLDDVAEEVEFTLPADFRALSPSFFQGMFAESVQKFSSTLEFFEHYRFNVPAHIRAKLIEYAEQTAGRH